jgi:hypothetical protein
MCLMCIEMAKDRLTKQDFVNNYLELVISDPEHAEEVFDAWKQKAQEEELFELD